MWLSWGCDNYQGQGVAPVFYETGLRERTRLKWRLRPRARPRARPRLRLRP